VVGAKPEPRHLSDAWRMMACCSARSIPNVAVQCCRCTAPGAHQLERGQCQVDLRSSARTASELNDLLAVFLPNDENLPLVLPQASVSRTERACTKTTSTALGFRLP